MTKRNNKAYTNEFKREAIKLALEALSINSAAKSLGISGSTLHTWVKHARNSGEQVITDSNGIVNHVNVTNIINENRELKKRLARLEMEKAILKKAATYFAAELK